jgi:hypothetical protein
VQARPAGSRAAQRAQRVLSAREQMERAFLAQCIAAPEAGAQALEGLDVESLFTSEPLQRAARHLSAGELSEPLRELADPDEELVALLAELVVEAGRWALADAGGQPATLEVQRLQLELAGIDRRIRAARAAGGGEVSELAQRKAEVKRRFDDAQERALQESGAGS